MVTALLVFLSAKSRLVFDTLGKARSHLFLMSTFNLLSNLSFHEELLVTVEVRELVSTVYETHILLYTVARHCQNLLHLFPGDRV